jgi:hypothetical protein
MMSEKIRILYYALWIAHPIFEMGVFVDVFRAFHTLRDLGTVLFKWAGLVMLLVAGVVSVSTNSSQIAPWMQAIITSPSLPRNGVFA